MTYKNVHFVLFFPLWIQTDFNLHPAIVVPQTGNHLINPFLNHPREAEDAIKTPQSHSNCTANFCRSFA